MKSLSIDFCTQFWALAHPAIAAGIITVQEAYIIARMGTRKERYWARHVQDLKAIIVRRES